MTPSEPALESSLICHTRVKDTRVKDGPLCHQRRKTPGGTPLELHRFLSIAPAQRSRYTQEVAVKPRGLFPPRFKFSFQVRLI